MARQIPQELRPPAPLLPKQLKGISFFYLSKGAAGCRSLPQPTEVSALTAVNGHDVLRCSQGYAPLMRPVDLFGRS